VFELAPAVFAESVGRHAHVLGDFDLRDAKTGHFLDGAALLVIRDAWWPANYCQFSFFDDFVGSFLHDFSSCFRCEGRRTDEQARMRKWVKVLKEWEIKNSKLL
jgi:hypothetical protein